MISELIRSHDLLHQRHKLLHELNIVIPHKRAFAHETKLEALEEIFRFEKHFGLVEIELVLSLIAALSLVEQRFVLEEDHLEQVE